MKILITVTLLALTLTACNLSQTPTANLQTQDFGTPANDIGHSVAATANGVYAVGYTNGSLDGPNRGGYDAFIRKYDGGVIWAKQFGTSSSDRAKRVVIDTAGNSYVFGETGGTFTYKKGGQDCFLRKYSPSGSVLWTRQTGTAQNDYLIDASIDSNNNLYTLCNQNYRNDIIRKWNSDGQVLLTLTIPDFETEGYQRFVAADRNGNIFVLGSASEPEPHPWKPGNDLMLYKYNSQGVLLEGFPKYIYPNISVQDHVYGMKLDSSNNLYIYHNILLGGENLIKTDSDGNILWVQSIDEASLGLDIAMPSRIALDADDNFYVIGITQYGFEGYDPPGEDTFYDGFVTKYDPSGTRLWARQFQTASQEEPLGVAVSDAVYVTGYGTGSPNLVGDPSHGGDDAFLARIDKDTGEILGIDQ